MRALRLEGTGGLQALRVGEVVEPRPGPGEVAVRVAAAGLNHVDLLLASGKLALQPSLPHVLGVEGAGEVAAVGEGVDTGMVGRRVTVYPYLGCGKCRFCFVGEEQVCPVGQGRCVGLTLPGTMAELVVVPARNAVPLPKGVSFEQAAAVSMTGSTAFRLVIGQGRPRPGETVLVRAVGSGMGVLALQLAKAAGAQVIGTAGAEEKLKRAAALGMDAGINHTTEDVAARVRELTGGEGADLVVDYVGAATWADNLRALARQGRLVLCGAHTGARVELDLWHLFAKELDLRGSYGGTREDLRRILELVAAGSVVSVIDRVVAVSEAQEAFELIEQRGQFGKVVISLV